MQYSMGEKDWILSTQVVPRRRLSNNPTKKKVLKKKVNPPKKVEWQSLEQNNVSYKRISVV